MAKTLRTPATRFVACALSLATSIIATYASGRYCVDVWGTGEGSLPQSSVISMIQSHDGYLWLGTLDGLVRFDGVRFSVFDESNTTNLSSIQIVKLFEDGQSNLWIGTQSSGAMLVTNGQILKLDIGLGRRKGHLVSICQDLIGAVWMLTEDRELARYWNGKVDVWNIPGENYIVGRSVMAEKSGTVWVGTDNQMFGLDPSGVHSKAPLPQLQNVPVEQLDFLLASRDGGYWRIADGRIQKFSGAQLQKDLGPYPWARTRSDVVQAACEDGAGNLIVGTLGQGVFWFDTHGHATHISTTNGLSNDYVRSLAMDSEGSLWVGLDGDPALNRVKQSIFRVLDSSAGLDVQSVSPDKQGGLWFSPHDEDVRYFKDGTTISVGSNPGPLNRLNPKAVLVDRNQDVWVATVGASLFHLEGNMFRHVSVPDAVNPEISALYQAHDGRLLLGTQGGLAQWNGQQWSLVTTNDGLSANLVRAITDDAQGNLWIGTEQGGLDLLRDGKFTSFRKSNGFPSDNISCLYLDTNGVLWIGTIGNGLIRLENGRWTHYTAKNGLPSNSIDYIIEDDQGFLWVGSNVGLMRIGKRSLNDFAAGTVDFLICRGYDKRDGLPINECTYGSQPAACRTPDGMLWFPTTAGLASVNPSEIQINTNPPPVMIESVVVGDEQPTNGLHTPPPTAVTIPPGKENLEIQYTSLNLAAGSRTFFRYRLEGYQTAWIEAGKVRFARYPNLPPGNYKFQVQACNEDGVWNRTGAILMVVVLPPFWDTWWFRTALGLALLGIIIGAVHYISTQKLNRQLAGLRQEQALEKERARIARDIHDQVGASLTQLSLLGEMVEADKNVPEEAESHARQISQTARETAHALDEIVWTVNPSNDTLDGLVNYICKNAQEYLAVAGLRFRLDVPSQLPPLEISPEARHNVFLAAKESVTNIVRHAHASEAWLRLRLEADQFTLEIEDNGRGPAGSKEKAAQSRNGLRNMRRRMEDVGGQFFIGPGKDGGTLVRLNVPLRKP
jgi:signal transduction histidine kinase/ligand-binding sensor domain-containing protein